MILIKEERKKGALSALLNFKNLYLLIKILLQEIYQNVVSSEVLQKQRHLHLMDEQGIHLLPEYHYQK